MLDGPKSAAALAGGEFTPLDAEAAAKRARLSYVSDSEPGIRRKGGQKRFWYVGPDGETLREGDVVRRLVTEHHRPERQRRHFEGAAPKIAILNHSSSPFQLMCSATWQATWWPGLMERNSGSATRQSSVASGQRVWNRQPDGMLLGFGRSPPRGAACLGREGSGTAAIRARV